MRILLDEDEPRIANFVARGLRKLGIDDDFDPVLIYTRRGEGYIFSAETEAGDVR